MTIHQNAFPDGVSKEVRDLLEHYMDSSNSSSAHHSGEQDEEYFASLFTDDGEYDFMGTVSKGHNAIRDFRHELFKNIPHRDHRITHVYTQGKNDMEMMALGEVDYKHHHGGDGAMAWAGRYILARTDKGLKFKLAMVIADPARQGA